MTHVYATPALPPGTDSGRPAGRNPSGRQNQLVVTADHFVANTIGTALAYLVGGMSAKTPRCDCNCDCACNCECNCDCSDCACVCECVCGPI